MLRLSDEIANGYGRGFIFVPGELPRRLGSIKSSIAVPQTCASAVLLGRTSGGKCEPIVGSLPSRLPGGGTRFLLFALNPSSTPVTLCFKVIYKDRKERPERISQFTLQPGQIWRKELDLFPRARNRRERILSAVDWEGGPMKIRRTIEPLHEELGEIAVNFLTYRTLQLAPYTGYALCLEVWCLKGAKPQLGVHDKFTNQFVLLAIPKVVEERWIPFRTEFRTVEQGWLRLYLYYRGDRTRKVRYRNIYIEHLPE